MKALSSLATLPLAALLLVSGGCSVFGPAFEQPGPGEVADAEAEAEEREETAAPSGPRTVSEEYPFIRFLRQTDGKLRAFIPVPLGYGGPVEALLTKNCPCLVRETDPAIINTEEPEQGIAVVGDPTMSAYDIKFKPIENRAVEDLLVVVGGDDDIREILEFIDIYWNSAPQVEIQAQIVEITNTDAFERGVESLSLQNTKDGNPYVFPRLDDNGNPIIDPNTGLWDQPTTVRRPGPFLRGFNTDLPFPSAGGGFDLAIIRDSFILDAFLHMVRTIEGADIVSRPRVVTRNGVAAQLTSKEKIPYQQFKNINTNGNTSAAVGFLDVGVNLHVLPVIFGADTIHLSYNIDVSRAGRLVAIAPDVFMPATTNRSATSEVMVRSGQSVVIGGLILNEKRNLNSRVPVLGSIPLIGWLFSFESTQETQTEVFFLITPVIKTRAATIEPYGDIFDPFPDENNEE